jgi:uncharacterized protein (DUF58 family)
MQPPWEKYLDPRTLAKLHGLPLRARRIVEGYVSGRHRSASRGFSIEFAEHREYAPGDDLRYLDWKVFGRTDKFYLKQFEDETNLTCYLLVDASQSMCYGSDPAGLSKLEYAKCFAASLAWLVLQQQDAVGLVVLDHAMQAFLSPSSAPSQLRHVLQAMEHAVPGRPTRLAAILHEIAQRRLPRGVMILLSDLFDDPTALTLGLKHLRHQQHDVAVFHVLDRAELEFPFQGTTRFRHMEQDFSVMVDSSSVRQAYLREFRRVRHELQSACRKHQIEYYLTRTEQPLDQILSRFLLPRRTQQPGVS